MQTSSGSTKDNRNNYWKSQIQSWKASGLSQKQYCQRESLALSTFCYWKRKIERDMHSRVEFFPLTLTSPAQPAIAKSTGLTLLVCRKRFAIEVEEDFSQEALTQLVSALELL